MGGAHEERHESLGKVGSDHLVESVGAHRERLIMGHDADPVGADAGDPQSLLDARMRL